MSRPSRRAAVRAPRRHEAVSPPSGDDGNAVLEFVALSVVILVPFVYLLVSVFAVQRASFGVTQAAREAARVLATSDDLDSGLLRAQAAASLAMRDQGVSAVPSVTYVPAGSHCSGAGSSSAASLAPGASFTVCVTERLALPYTDKGLLHLGRRAAISVTARSLVNVDAYRGVSRP